MIQLAPAAASSFPFTIQGGHFLRDGSPVFLQMLSYQPLEPGQSIEGQIREARIQDDLRRLRDFQGGSDPILLRVYAQPTPQFPVRMPKSFYNGVRELGFWIVRDIYFEANYEAPSAIAKGKAAIDAVMAEVAAVGAFDRIFAWEIGNEFVAEPPESIAALNQFVCAMATHVKARMAELGRENFSHWVTWGSLPLNDPLRTGSIPVFPICFDYISYNAYSYDPERLRDQQAGPGTGTPFAGYLAALKERYPNHPLVISETGLPDSPSIASGGQTNLAPWYPAYRRGGLSDSQSAEGLTDRYWDARLSGAVAGIGIFEWNDEWHKAGNPSVHDDHPEEYFGLLRFGGSPLKARAKLQLETVRDLFTLQFSNAPPEFSLSAENTSLTATGVTKLHALVAPGAAQPVRFRWETTRGFIVGDSDTVEFYAGGRALGPATVTALVIDAHQQAGEQKIAISIQPGSPASVQILTFGKGSNSVARASGRVSNADLGRFKLVAYIQTDKNYVQPFADMTSIWNQPDGYWWTPVDNRFNGRLNVGLVPKSYVPPLTLPSGASPPGQIASATLSTVNDADNDLLPDAWEPAPLHDRYSDSDNDGANNLEEFLAGTSPVTVDNDSDGDGLPDNWERRYFGRLNYGATDDSDGDGLNNLTEFKLGLHPGRTAPDQDRDGLPDAWERRWFGNLDGKTSDDPDGDGFINFEAFELGIAPAEIKPLLEIRALGETAMVLCWPSLATGFGVETTEQLLPQPTWTPINITPAVVGNRNVLTNQISGWTRFFRLRKP